MHISHCPCTHKQAKEARAVVAVANRKRATKKAANVLEEARVILRVHQTRRASANKHLKASHFLQLLINLGKKQNAYESAGPRKGKVFKIADLRRIYWHHHQPLTTTAATETVTPEVVEAAATDTVTPVVVTKTGTGMWGVKRVEREFQSESESESDWDSGGVSESESESVGESLINHSEWEKLGSCEVEEETVPMFFREVDILGRRDKVRGENVCLWFGGDEYEGLPGGKYRFENGNLYDDENNPILFRDLDQKILD